ncbi:ribose 5-phosphate isomerase B [Arcanobacterium pluranimalium]|uniref:ribose-5-phosphate isomerase n=1 Tax=Arcanobacterium pluranimalium TaxID=108028 RepID=UPI00195E6932|nr:ribose-5-phosphate isomerase [Arcanobacterium pluranimalium]MBM7825715.1 ribose 5-phosphate isomerase B [Arcanobacterium pluranimalium]
MRVHIATDHAGFELKNHLVEHLGALGHEVIDHGYHVYDKLDAYPPVCFECAQAVVDDAGSLGIVIGGSGNGEQIAANKVPGVRAALAWNESTAQLAREHNNANVISLGARQHTIEEATRLVEIFLNTGYDVESRHQSRIDMIADFENQR